MKKVFKITAVVLAALLLALALAACGAEIDEVTGLDDDEQAIRALIAECESACRAKDIERVLKTLDPKVEKTVRKLAGLAAKVTGNEELTFEGIVGALGVGEADGVTGEEIEDAIEGLSLEVKEVALNGSKAEAKTDASFKSGATSFSTMVVIKCKKSDGKWYITGIKMPKEEN